MLTSQRVVVACLMIAALSTQAQAQAIQAEDGWEAFPAVEYQGGHVGFPRKLMGTLVLTDSTIALHACPTSSCAWPTSGRRMFTDSVIFSIPLRAVREISASTLTRSPGIGRRIAWGALANSRTDEYFVIAYETESSAEAPMFKVQTTHGGALDAKIRFRLRRLGVELPQ